MSRGRACLSSIVVKASRQVSDSVTRVDREQGWVPANRVDGWFLARVREHARNLGALAAALPDTAAEPRIRQADARDTRGLKPGSVGGIVSSPPYPGTFDYVEHHRRRYVALGLNPKLAEQAELGSRREQRRLGWREATARFGHDLSDAMRAWRRALARNGRVLLVLGDGQHRDGIIETLPLALEAGERAGLKTVASVSQPRRVRGHVDGGGVRHKEEHVIALEHAR